MKRGSQLFNCYLPSFRALPSIVSGHESVSRSGVPSGGSDDFRVPCLAASILSTITFEQWFRPFHCSNEKQNARYFRKRTIVNNCVNLMAIGRSENRFPVNKLKRVYFMRGIFSIWNEYCDDKMNKFHETIRVIKNFSLLHGILNVL